MTKTQIQFPDPLYKRLKSIAARNDWSLAEVVRRAIEVYADRFPEDIAPSEPRTFPTIGDRGDYLLDPAGVHPEAASIEERSS
jgi:hypothetical protein